MKHLINILELTQFIETDDGPFKERYATVSDKVGAKKLGYNVVILEPGFKSCPFHNHHIAEEMFLILAGEGSLRFGEDTHPLKQGDLIACPPGGREVAHQIINTSDKPLKYLALSTNEPYDVCEYPDSNKIMTLVGEQGNRSLRHIARLNEAVDYFDGEK